MIHGDPIVGEIYTDDRDQGEFWFVPKYVGKAHLIYDQLMAHKDLSFELLGEVAGTIQEFREKKRATGVIMKRYIQQEDTEELGWRRVDK